MRPLAYRLAALVVAALVAFPLVGSATSSLNPPSGTITSITPASGPTAGGTTITILGTDLYYGTSGPAVTIGGASAPVTSWRNYGALGETEIIATTPPGAAGAADVRVVTADPSYNDRLLALSQGGFTYVAPTPTITATAVSPTSGLTTGGEVVTITGTGFSGATAPTVTFAGADGTKARGTAVTVASDTSLTVATPPLAKGEAGISVTQGGATAYLAGRYTYNRGYWVTVTNTWPRKLGELLIKPPGGAVRLKVGSGWAGDWAQTWSDTHIVYTDYRGGLNCGDRRVHLMDLYTEATTAWEGGPCRVAVASGDSITLAALPGSDITVFPPFFTDLYLPFVASLRGNCSAFFGQCVVNGVSRDVSVRAIWGILRIRTTHDLMEVDSAFSEPSGEDKGGELTDYEVSSTFKNINTAGPSPKWKLDATTTNTSVTRRPTAQHASNKGTVVCSAPGRLVGKRISARCAVSPGLAAALTRGSVRLSATWKVRLPNQRSWRTVSTGRLLLRNRAGTARVTG